MQNVKLQLLCMCICVKSFHNVWLLWLESWFRLWLMVGYVVAAILSDEAENSSKSD